MSDLQYTLGLEDDGSFQGQVEKAKKSCLGLGSVLAGIGAGAFAASFLKRGLDFNQTMRDSESAVAKVLAQFQGLNDTAAKNEAAKAMRQLIALEPKAAGSLTTLVDGFMATLGASQSAGLSVQQNIDLVGKFANAMDSAKIPTEQLSQEMRSILTANIGADSTLAGMLGLTNEMIEQARKAGNLYDFLSLKLGKMSEAGDTASVAFSSLESAIDKAAGALTAELFTHVVDASKNLTATVDDNTTAFESLGRAIGTAAKELVKFTAFLGEAYSQTSRLTAITLTMIQQSLSYEEAAKVIDAVAEARERDTEKAKEQAEGAKKAGDAAAAAAKKEAEAAAIKAKAQKEAREVTEKAFGKGKGHSASGTFQRPADDPIDGFAEVERQIDAQRRLDELKKSAAMDEMSTAQKIAMLHADLAKALEEEQTLRKDPFGGAGERLIDAETRRVELQREINQLQRQFSEEKRREAATAEREAATAAREAAQAAKKNEALQPKDERYDEDGRRRSDGRRRIRGSQAMHGLSDLSGPLSIHAALTEGGGIEAWRKSQGQDSAWKRLQKAPGIMDAARRAAGLLGPTDAASLAARANPLAGSKTPAPNAPAATEADPALAKLDQIIVELKRLKVA